MIERVTRATDTDRGRRFWDEVAQTLPRGQLRKLQDERAGEAVARANEAGFFHRRFGAAGVAPDDISTVDDLARLPTFRKADLRESEATYPPVGDYRVTGLRGAIRLATSTGT